MPEPITTGLAAKYTYAVSGFFGGLVSLRFVTALSWWGALSSVGTGAICAQFLAPIAIRYWGTPQELQGGVAFLIGLTSMNLVPALIKASTLFLDDPVGRLRELLNVKR